MMTEPRPLTTQRATIRHRAETDQNSIKTLPSTGISPPIPIPAIKQKISNIGRFTDSAAPMPASPAKRSVFLKANNLPYLSLVYPQM